MKNNFLRIIHLLQYCEVSEVDFEKVVNVVNKELGLVYNQESKFDLEDYTDMSWTIYNNQVFYSPILYAQKYVNPILKSEYYNKSIYENEDVVAILCECVNQRKTIKLFKTKNKLDIDEFEKFIEKNAYLPETNFDYVLEEKKMIQESNKKKEVYLFQLFEKKYKIIVDKSKKEETYTFNSAEETKIAFDNMILQKSTEGFVDFYSSNLCQRILENIKELAQPTSKFIIKRSKKRPTGTQLESHFGGDPYFEKGEKWPTNSDGRDLDFIFQVINNEGLQLPEEIKIIQLFCDPDGMMIDEEDFLVKTYSSIQTDEIQSIKNKEKVIPFGYIEFKNTLSLPDWQLLDVKHKRLSKQLKSLFYEYDREYDKICELISGEENVSSRLGGYPDWIQNDDTPKNSDLLFQLESNDEQGLQWGDMGAMYAFYNKESKKISACFMQCF